MARSVLALSCLMLVVAPLVTMVGGCKEGGTYLFSTADEIKLGQEAAAEFEVTNPISRDARITSVVSGIGAKLAQVTGGPKYPYTFRVIDSNTVNAVAFPGGRIYMYRGLYDKLGGDRDMVAWVLGHEITHVALQHSAKRIEREMGVAAIAQALLGKGSAAQVANVVSSLMFQDYGRDKELQADQYGLLYAARAGYDPTAALAVLKVFQSLGGNSDPSKLELLFMSHPGDNTRINQIKALCAQNGYRGKYYP